MEELEWLLSKRLLNRSQRTTHAYLDCFRTNISERSFFVFDLSMVQELIKALVFGIVEGISEWLPISSTGHMLLLERFVTLHTTTAFWNMFLVVIQLGAILAVLVTFFSQLNIFSTRLSASERRLRLSLWGKIILACIPAAVIGIPLDDWMEEHLGSPFVIAGALIVYGIVFIVIEKARALRERARLSKTSAFARVSAYGSAPVSSASSSQPKHLKAPQEAVSASAGPSTQVALEQISWAQALGVGCFQVLSIVPGTSRSGSCIIGGLLLGLDRISATQFTFYLALPVMFGASLLRIVKFVLHGNVLSSTELGILITGLLSAFLVSWVVVSFLLKYLKRHNFVPFGWYRIVLGVIVAAYFLLCSPIA